jgi:hypothetical protein
MQIRSARNVAYRVMGLISLPGIHQIATSSSSNLGRLGIFGKPESTQRSLTGCLQTS